MAIGSHIEHFMFAKPETRAVCYQWPGCTSSNPYICICIINIFFNLYSQVQTYITDCPEVLR